MKPNGYRLELEPARLGAEPTEDEVVAAYRAACPGGEPPLAAVRGYVLLLAP